MITEDSFLRALKDVDNVILTCSSKTSLMSGLETYKMIINSDADIVASRTLENNGRYYCLSNGQKFIINVLEQG